MRPMALTRKNALFAGSDEGAENWAVLASLIETCKLHGVNPEAYFTDVLTKLVNNWPNSRLAELLPWAWTAETPLIRQSPIPTVIKQRLRPADGFEGKARPRRHPVRDELRHQDPHERVMKSLQLLCEKVSPRFN